MEEVTSVAYSTTDLSGWITAISAFCSAILLLFYTFYTYRMQKAVENQAKELVHQRRLGAMPSLLTTVSHDAIVLENIGNGSALNISILPAIVDRELRSFGGITAIWEFEKIKILRSHEKSVVSGRRRGSSTSSDESIKLDEIWSGIAFLGVLIFQDIEGRFYEQDLTSEIEETIRHEFPRPITSSRAKELAMQSKQLIETRG